MKVGDCFLTTDDAKFTLSSMKKSRTALLKIDEGDFLSSINKTIAEGRHVDYLQSVLKDYEWYKEEFDRVFTDKQPVDVVYVFRATYLLKQQVWREFEMSGRNTFNDFAEAIIVSMGWDNDHMHGFSVAGRERKSFVGDGHREEAEFFAPGWEDDPFPTYKSDQIRICQIDYQIAPKLDFIFDYGDGHRFTIVFKGTRAMSKKEGRNEFLRLIDQRGVGPKQYPPVEE